MRPVTWAPDCLVSLLHGGASLQVGISPPFKQNLPSRSLGTVSCFNRAKLARRWRKCRRRLAWPSRTDANLQEVDKTMLSPLSIRTTVYHTVFALHPSNLTPLP